MMVMFSVLVLGIFPQVVDFKHYMELKVILSLFFALITSSFYRKYARSMKLSPIVQGFGTMISLFISGTFSFITADIVLKIIGLE